MISLKQHPPMKFASLAFVWASVLLIPAFAPAQDWRVQVGAQSKDKALQVIAFLPNEIWIHAGDSVAFKVATDEPHTVTFLTPNQVVPPFSIGCPGTTSSAGPGTTQSGGAEDGTSCVNSGPLTNGQGYSVTFPAPGDYKLVCLFHQNHTAVIHVLDLSAELPHEQAFYSAEAADMQRDLLSAANNVKDRDTDSSPAGVTAGTGSILATGGGSDTLSVVRFMHPDKIVHVRDTVEWTNDDPVTPHTITFGVEPQPTDFISPSPGLKPDQEGVLHATVSSPKDNVHSGFIVAAPQNEIGSPQPPLSTTRFRVTFTRPGIFPYKCVLHDNLGMVGRVIVLP